MAKVKVVGDAAVVISSLKLSDIELVKKYRPKALVLFGGEDGKEPVFAIGTTNGAGGINQYGATFNGATHDDSQLACITMVMKNAGADVKEWLADQIGSALMSLNKLEEILPDVIEEIAEERAGVIDSIDVGE